MTQKFQAGVGPDQKRCHIYRVGDDPRMSLCRAVCIARNYKADLAFNNGLVCKRCVRDFLKQWNSSKGTDPNWRIFTADDLGVSALETYL